jgi:hypothetical protein
MGCCINSKFIEQHAKTGRQLVISTKPAIHMNGRYLGSGALLLKYFNDAFYIGRGKRGNILGKINGEIGFTVSLVTGNRRAGNQADYLGLQGVEPFAARSARDFMYLRIIRLADCS